MSIEGKGLIAGLLAGLAALGGTFGIAALVRPSLPAPHQSAPAGAAALQQTPLVKGHAFYTQSCASCHGAQGQGRIGPRLIHSSLSDAQMAAVIQKGVTGAMPAFGNKYKGADLQALVAYVRSLK